MELSSWQRLDHIEAVPMSQRLAVGRANTAAAEAARTVGEFGEQLCRFDLDLDLDL